jgi:anti-sigma-K factor RskA
VAAALILAVIGTGFAVNANRDGVVRDQAEEIEALGDVARWTLDVDAQPDAKRIELASSTGDPTTATLLYSPSTSKLVVVADRLAPPPAGKEYRCWVVVDGQRQPIGKMFFGGDLAYWVGDVPEVAGLDQKTTFGVSLIDLASPQTPGQPVLVGEG